MVKKKLSYSAKKIIQSKSTESDVKSIPSPTAQTVKLCQPDDPHMVLLNHLLSVIASKTKRYEMERVLCDLMLSGGLRVSEALQPNQFKVSFLGQVFIKGSKGSEDKLVTPLFFKDFWKKRSGTLLNPFVHISRFSFHKWLMSESIYIVHGNNKKNSTTHAMRHLHVYLMQIMEMDSEQIRKVLGHKGTNAIKFYLNGK